MLSPTFSWRGRRWALAVGVALGAVAVDARAEPDAETKRVAVMAVKVDPKTSPTVAKQMTARIAEVIGTRPNVSVMAPDDIRAMLESEAQKQMMGCAEDSCLAQIGGALGADLLVSGRINRIDDGYGISLSAVSPDDAEAKAHVTEVWRGESIALLELVPALVDRLLAEPGEDLTGSVDVVGAVEGARILIDDQVRGTAPAGAMGKIPIGAHKLQVVAEDYVPYEAMIVVKKGEVTTVPIDLAEVESGGVHTKWWFWTAVAVAVGGGVATTFALTGSDPAPAGTTGVSVGVSADGAFGGGR